MALHGDSELTENETTITYNKIARESKQHGFRDGVMDGKEKSFQKSFDEGYKDGFKNGFALGKLKGELRVKNDINFEGNDDVLDKTKRGACKMCTDATLLEKRVKDIKVAQSLHVSAVLNDLNAKYSSGND